MYISYLLLQNLHLGQIPPKNVFFGRLYKNAFSPPSKTFYNTIQDIQNFVL